MRMILMNSLSSRTLHHDLLLLLILALLLMISTCDGKSNTKCVPSSCGDIRNISSPFRLMGDLEGCGDHAFELACENNSTVMYLYHGRYYVRSIDYFGDTYGAANTYGIIRLVDEGLQKDNCPSLPRYSLTGFNFSFGDPYTWNSGPTISIINCSKPVDSPSSYVPVTEPCMKTSHDSSSNVSRINYYLYVVLNANASDVEDFCTVAVTVTGPDLTAEEENRLKSYDRFHNIMVDGFNLSFFYPQYKYISQKFFICYFGPVYIPRHLGWCGYDYYPPETFMKNIAESTVAEFIIFLAHFVAAKFSVGAPFVLIFLIRKWRRRHLAMDANIEDFLQANNNFLPIRYSYSVIKKITKNFKHKLGEGGYGSVYRGKLRSGREVAIKVLKISKGNNQDFINEVATVGRIHHVNVVQLIDFCIEGSKQALVYHFMSNGSLDKHIFSKIDGNLLDCKKIYEIALGVAKGIEYLHRGCDIQILHFDIKPHNILLDENFTPKVSDFGLARLYPTDRSIVSLTAARGTLGYMAPELFYKDIGGVSYKADVYSFGMLLMEMACRRRNFDANTECSSQSYFPLWVYDQLNKGEEESKELLEEEHKLVRKMIIVAFWCIQLSPVHRPSMKKVINMLEGDINELQVPPRPLLYPTNSMLIVGDRETEVELNTFSSSSSTPIISAIHRFENTSEIWEASAP